MARPRFTPSSEQRTIVSIMASCGFTHNQIAEKVQVDPKTLRRTFRNELDQGMQTANAIVAQSLFKKATGDGKSSVVAAIWWEKTRAGKKDISSMELTGKDGGPIHAHIARELIESRLDALAARSGQGG